MVFFVIPICIITILYILIGLKLRASSKSVHHTVNNNYQNQTKSINNHNNDADDEYRNRLKDNINNKSFIHGRWRSSGKCNSNSSSGGGSGGGAGGGVNRIKFSFHTPNHNHNHHHHHQSQNTNDKILTISGSGNLNPSLGVVTTSGGGASSLSSTQSSPLHTTNGNNSKNDHQQQQQQHSPLPPPSPSSPSTTTTHALQHSMSMSVRRQNASRRAVIKMLGKCLMFVFY